MAEGLLLDGGELLLRLGDVLNHLERSAVAELVVRRLLLSGCRQIGDYFYAVLTGFLRDIILKRTATAQIGWSPIPGLLRADQDRLGSNHHIAVNSGGHGLSLIWANSERATAHTVVSAVIVLISLTGLSLQLYWGTPMRRDFVLRKQMTQVTLVVTISIHLHLLLVHLGGKRVLVCFIFN